MNPRCQEKSSSKIVFTPYEKDKPVFCFAFFLRELCFEPREAPPPALSENALTSTISDGSEYNDEPCPPHATTRYCRNRAGFLESLISFSFPSSKNSSSPTNVTCAVSSASTSASFSHRGLSPARRCNTYACTGGVPVCLGARHCTATEVWFTATARTFVGAPGGAPSPSS